MLRLAPAATPLLAQGLGGRFGPGPPNFKRARAWPQGGRGAAGAGSSNFAQVLAQRSLAGRIKDTTPPGKQPVWEAGAILSRVGMPFQRKRLATSKAHSYYPLHRGMAR